MLSAVSRFSSLRALRHSPFAWLWSGAFLSNVGTWMENVAIGLFVVQHTGRAGWLGTIAGLLFLPSLLLGPFAGALSDRLNRRAVLCLGAVAHGSLGLVLWVLHHRGTLSVPAVAGVALLSGCVTALYNPTMNALVAQLVEKEDLPSAYSLNSAQYNLGRVVGPVVAALLIARYSVGAAFVGKALGFAAVLFALLRLRIPPPQEPAPRESILESVKDGLARARAEPAVWFSLKTTFWVSVAVAPFIGLIPVMSVQLLGGGAKETSLLVSCQGLGAVCAALAMGPLAERWGRRRLLEYSLLAAGVATTLYWMSPNLRFASVSIFILGGSYLLSSSGLLVICQSRTPPEFAGRVNALYSAILSGCYSLGVAGHGWLGDVVGVRGLGVLLGLAFLGLVQFARTRPDNALAVLETASG